MFQFLALALVQLATITTQPATKVGGSGWGGDIVATVGGSGWGGDITSTVGGSGWGDDLFKIRQDPQSTDV